METVLTIQDSWLLGRVQDRKQRKKPWLCPGHIRFCPVVSVCVRFRGSTSEGAGATELAEPHSSIIYSREQLWLRWDRWSTWSTKSTIIHAANTPLSWPFVLARALLASVLLLAAMLDPGTQMDPLRTRAAEPHVELLDLLHRGQNWR